ncbi:MAG: glycine/betaine/sarcosine/D-proline family reductase selenoprotein B [Candidatus Binatia bacterium]
MARIIHYLNQFYAQIGGEDKAGQEVIFVRKPLGIGAVIHNSLPGNGNDYATIICGDNYFHEQEELAMNTIRKFLDEFRPDILIAGPAFNAGRYGLACAKVCSDARERWRIPTLTGMYEENPGTREIARHVFVLETGPSVTAMQRTLKNITKLLDLLISKNTEAIENFRAEFCLRIPRRFTIKAEAPDFVRAADLLLAKLKGKPYESEIPFIESKPHSIPAAIGDLGSATLALVTEGGLVPKGNPDRLESTRGTRFLKYSIKDRDDLKCGEFEAMHTGYDTSMVNEDPDRIVPLDALRELEKAGRFKKLHDYYYVTTGTGAYPSKMEEIGAGIAEELVGSGIQGVILTST